VPRQITVIELARMLTAGEPVKLVDVRQPWENDLAALSDSVLIPLPELDERWPEVDASSGGLVVTYCHHGIRSLDAAALLEGRGIARVASLAGGIDAWSRDIDPKISRY
jgi:rhodanese-related sulfurtransferase